MCVVRYFIFKTFPRKNQFIYLFTYLLEEHLYLVFSLGSWRLCFTCRRLQEREEKWVSESMSVFIVDLRLPGYADYLHGLLIAWMFKNLVTATEYQFWKIFQLPSQGFNCQLLSSAQSVIECIWSLIG